MYVAVTGEVSERFKLLDAPVEPESRGDDLIATSLPTGSDYSASNSGGFSLQKWQRVSATGFW